jgi:hypothetical protein
MTNYCYKYSRYRPGKTRLQHFSFFFFLITSLFLAALTSCEDEGTLIGKGLLPGKDFISVYSIDTISINSFTEYDDSIPSSNPVYSYMGQIYDPYFGTTTAEFVTQVRLLEEWKETTYTIDSVRLYLSLVNVQGSKGPGHFLNIEEIARQLYIDSIYYSSSSIPLTGMKWMNIPLPELKPDTINFITIDIPSDFGNYVLRDTAMLFHSNAVPDFRSYFKGLKFSLKSLEDPVFTTVSLDPPGTFEISENFFVIYFHNSAGEADQYWLILDAKTKNARYNIFKHNYDAAQPGKKIEHIGDGVKDTLSYLQSLNGVYTRFTIPALDDLRASDDFKNISISKARLVYPVWYDGSIYKASTIPSQLFMRYYTNTGTRYLVPDYFISTSFFDGRADTVSSVYNFNIASYVQSYLEDETGRLKPEFELILPAGSLNNAILRANNSSAPVKFEFTYTRY